MRISVLSSDVCSSDLAFRSGLRNQLRRNAANNAVFRHILGDDGIGPHGTAISQMNAPNDLRPSANEYPVTQNGRARPFAAIDLSQHGAVSQVGVRADHRVSVDIDDAEAIAEQSRANHRIFGARKGT